MHLFQLKSLVSVSFLPHKVFPVRSYLKNGSFSSNKVSDVRYKFPDQFPCNDLRLKTRTLRHPSSPFRTNALIIALYSGKDIEWLFTSNYFPLGWKNSRRSPSGPKKKAIFTPPRIVRGVSSNKRTPCFLSLSSSLSISLTVNAI